ncbi:ER membrane protein complex subunit 5-like [Daphnia pulex]|uniref:ER membrane protein complex subunit 5-like n=1 Tax=Daphnia pulex TaxID=6669 RepID=UPI001EDD68BC|nr:ER membrane protein complex subunit 5-like [Daphnia pulex]
MSSSMNKYIFILGMVLLFHAAYSAAQHRSYLRLTEQEFTSLPADIVLQTIFSLLLTVFGVTTIAGEFKEIRSNIDLQKKTWKNLNNRPSFYTFNHRGHIFNPIVLSRSSTGKGALEAN